MNKSYIASPRLLVLHTQEEKLSYDYKKKYLSMSALFIHMNVSMNLKKLSLWSKTKLQALMRATITQGETSIKILQTL